MILGGTFLEERLVMAGGSVFEIEILLEGQSFTVEEARALGLVNAIAPSGDLDVQAVSKAEHFASKSKLALSSLVLAMNNSYGSMDEYLDAVGTGFDKIYSES